MKRWADLILPVVVFAALLGLIAWWQFALWEECRSTNSFWYCVRILSR